MKLIDQHTKKIMEECKEKAEAAGLNVHGETLEYIVTNQDLIELSPKIMIPTLYDYWVHDVEIIRDKWIYDVFPNNPYETVINTRPAISFYNDNNPNWFNVMIFYHVLGHIDFMQNNVFFRNTWDDDFCGQALADKRLLNRIREEMGVEKRWVDYVIEFARGIDNLVGYYPELEEIDKVQMQDVFGDFSEKVNFYFDEFLRRRHEEKTIALKFYDEEIKRFNRQGEAVFFNDPGFMSRFPEFNRVFEKHQKKEKKTRAKDIFQYLIEHSEFLNKEKNKWMKEVLQVVRNTSLYFQPQFRDQICNEGWASFWHERLFIADKRIKGHEVKFAKINSGVMLDPKVGFNPYAFGKHLFEFIEELAMKGKLSYRYQLLEDNESRKHYNQELGEKAGKKALFEIRKNFNDFMLVNFLSDKDFQDFIDRYNLFVAGVRPSFKHWDFAEVYIKSKSGKEYREMINKSLYHPPHCLIDEEKAEKEGSSLYINHIFEGRQLVTKYIPSVLIGLSYFCGNKKVNLETTEIETEQKDVWKMFFEPWYKPKHKKVRVLYTCEKKDIKRKVIGKEEVWSWMK